jgi:hypothetical protein
MEEMTNAAQNLCISAEFKKKLTFSFCSRSHTERVNIMVMLWAPIREVLCSNLVQDTNEDFCSLLESSRKDEKMASQVGKDHFIHNSFPVLQSSVIPSCDAI